MSDWNSRANEIFTAAVELLPEDRHTFVEQQCAGDVVLRAQVESLLNAHVAAGSFLAHPLVKARDLQIEAGGVQGDCEAEATKCQSNGERIGAQIGPFKLLEEIGEGGFGVVFLAEQMEPVRRQVALKIIKPGMDTREVIARFEAERQALALMDHPNISKVLDAGTTEPPRSPEGRGAGGERAGRPYFVMELVKGIPITEYCDQCSLTTRERLELFIGVCRAVQHAHQKGIIHRDIKPSNVLVAMQDGRPTPKIIDFGVAKALNQRLTDRTLQTRFAQMLGTPMYMSPEQAELSPLEVDTRSDIYSLGVLLYELLTGTTPFEKERLSKASFDDLRRIIREEEPPRPSARISTLGAELTTIAQRRRVEPHKLQQQVRGDLDWIVMKCLEKDRTRRYETANGLAREIQCYLNDEPVRARPPSPRYRFQKFVRRNRGRLTIAVCVMATFVILGTTAMWLVRARNQQRMVVTAQIERALTDADELQQEGRFTDATSAAERAVALLNDDVDASLHTRAKRRLVELHVVSEVERIRLAWQGAERPRPSLERISESDGLPVETPLSLFTSERADAAYATAFRELGIQIEDLSVDQAVAQIRARNIAADLVTALDHWALVRRQLQDASGSDRLLAVAQDADPDTWRKRLRELSAKTPIDRAALRELAVSAPVEELPASTVVRLAEVLSAAGMTAEAVAALRRAYAVHPDDFWISARLGKFCYALGDDDDAVRFCSVAIGLRPESAEVHAYLGLSLALSAEWDEGVAACEKAVALTPESSFAHASLAFALMRRTEPMTLPVEVRRTHPDLQRVEQAFHESIRLDPDYVWPIDNLGYLLSAQERWEEAESVLRDALRIKPDEFYPHYRLGLVLRHLERWDEAVPALRRAIELNPTSPSAYSELTMVYQETGRWDEFLAVIKEALAAVPGKLSLESIEHLVEHYQQVQDLEEAETVLQNAARLDPGGNQVAWGKVVEILEQQGGRETAISVLREAIRRSPQEYGPYVHLHSLLQREGRLLEAIGAYEWMIARQPMPIVHFALADAYQRRGESARAIEHYRIAIALKVREDLFTNAHVHLAQLLSQSDDPDERTLAVEYAQQAFSMRTQSNWCLQTLADAQFAANQWEGAAGSYRMLLKREGDKAPAANRLRLTTSLMHLAGFHNERGQFELAEEQFTAAAELYAEHLRADEHARIHPESELWMLLRRKEGVFAALTGIMPDDYRPWAARAQSLASEGLWERAAADYARALELLDGGPDAWWGPQATLAIWIAQQPPVYEQVALLRPDDVRLWIGLARYHSSHERWQEAADAMAKVLELHPDDEIAWYEMAPLKLQIGDVDGYRHVCETLLKRWPLLETTLKACLLSPNLMVDRFDDILAAADEIAAHVTDDDEFAPWLYLTRGLAAYRSRDFESARLWLERCTGGEPQCQASVRLLLSMVDYREGRTAEARDAYRDTLAFIDVAKSSQTREALGIYFHDWLICDILRREAERTLNIAISEVHQLEHDAEVNGVAFALSGDLVVSSQAGTPSVLVREATTGRLVQSFGKEGTPDCRGIVVSRDGQTIAYPEGVENGFAIYLRDLNTGQSTRALPGPLKHVTAMAFSPDGRLFASGSWGDTVLRIWDLETGTELHQCSPPDLPPAPKEAWVLDAMFTSDGRHVMAAHLDAGVILWDVTSGNIVRRFGTSDLDAVWTVALSPDDNLVASTGWDRVRLWDVESGRQLREFAGHTGRVRTARFSPDGRFLAFGAQDRTMRIWDVGSGDEVCRVESENHYPMYIEFSRDGKHLISGGGWYGTGDRAARLWRLPEIIWPTDGQN